MTEQILVEGGAQAPQTAPGGENTVERRILGAIRGIRYGSVEVVIHDSRIVQVERREKIRFDQTGTGGSAR